jgi:hypothetical protein
MNAPIDPRAVGRGRSWHPFRLPPEAFIPQAVEILDPIDPVTAAVDDALFADSFRRAETGGRMRDNAEE